MTTEQMKQNDIALDSRTEFCGKLTSCIGNAIQWLMGQQKEDGHWIGRTETNACMEAQACLALWFLGLEDHPLRVRLGNALLKTRREDGSWGVFWNAPNGDINATVESYAALRSLGYNKDLPFMKETRAWIFSKGGLKNIRVFTRYWLALVGEWPWEKTPNVPPEVIWFPLWFPFNIYNFAQWARATLVPLTVLSARRASRSLPQDRNLDELFPEGREMFDYKLPSQTKGDLWRFFFLKMDSFLHGLQTFCTRYKLTKWREASIKKVMEWVLAHQDSDGGWGGIQPPWIYGLMALYAEGYPIDHPALAKGLAMIDAPGWRFDEGDASFLQATNSPVWDTMLALSACNDVDVTDEYVPHVEKAIQWLLDHQIKGCGDWSVKLPHLSGGGWAFEYANLFYPDIDDTAVALTALAPYRKVPKWQEKGIEEAIQRGVRWLLGMQSQSGGWAAFDKDNNKRILTKIPFCDFGEALDPPSADVTAHVIEAFMALGISKGHPAVVRGVQFIKKEQEANGPWFGRWGVNYIYGTGNILPALAAAGEDMAAPNIAKACDWIVSRQQENGGWGESCESYMDASMAGRGTPTASQTAWALLALTAAKRPCDYDAIQKGCLFLISTQKEGTWEEKEYTGTGFPGYGIGQAIKLNDVRADRPHMQGAELSRAFMLRYDLYRHYFPMMALGRSLKLLEG